MTAIQIFETYTAADKCYQAGKSEFFLEKEEAEAYAKHFNVSIKEILRSEVIPDASPVKEPEQEGEDKEPEPGEPEPEDGDKEPVKEPEPNEPEDGDKEPEPAKKPAKQK